ncbi:NADP-dependent oxidoreductase domain-containing protein [Mariannaea sp. PMI_226]|nr:NADP-dependent oxidoreductase domain-containing protein [Mariannaea sp. PMI_226]
MTPLKPILIVGQTPIPHFIYGTGWKAENTTDSVSAALQAGFRAIDTAPQPQNYDETLVGKAITNWLATSPMAPESERRIFLQSKFTNPSGYGDWVKPFEDQDPPSIQVQKSLDQSLTRLGRGGMGQLPLDALLLHSPLATIEETMVYWRAMESHVPHRVTYLGICNVSLPTFTQLYASATIKPVIVQNDFRPAHGFDVELLQFCQKRSVVYQAYAVLKGNMALLKSPLVGWLAQEKGITEPEALYCLVLSCWDGQLCILNGTRSEDAMKKDLELLKKVGRLDKYIIDGFWEMMAATEDIDWSSGKSA